MEIEGREVTAQNFLDPVTYVPSYAEGNAGHSDCQVGVVISVGKSTVGVLYSHTRTVQQTDPCDLVWG